MLRLGIRHQYTTPSCFWPSYAADIKASSASAGTMPPAQQYSRSQIDRRNELRRRRRSTLHNASNSRRRNRIYESSSSSTRTPDIFRLPPIQQTLSDDDKSAVIQRRLDILEATRRSANIIIDRAPPCDHCGARLFKGEICTCCFFCVCNTMVTRQHAPRSVYCDADL